MKTQQDVVDKEATLRILEDVMRFGAAFGSWMETTRQWHNDIATEAMRITKERAYEEIVSQSQDAKRKNARKHLPIE